MTLHLTVSCNGTWPKDDGPNPMPCRGAFPARWSEDHEAGESFCLAVDEAAAAGWSFPRGIGALCPSCDRWRLMNPDKPGGYLEEAPKSAPTPQFSVYELTIQENRRALATSFAADFGVPPCVISHDWTPWALTEGGGAYIRRCERAGCSSVQTQHAGLGFPQ